MASIKAIRNIRQTYRQQREVVGATRKQAFIRTAATPIRAFWQKRQTPTPPSAAPSFTPSAAPTTPTATAPPPTSPIISHAEEIGEVEGTEEFIPPTPTAPPVSRKKRIAKWVGKWGVVVPAKIGYRSSIKILEAAEDMAKARIEKEMKIGKHKEKGEKTINCPYCLKKIPADSKFCPYCREQLE